MTETAERLAQREGHLAVLGRNDLADRRVGRGGGGVEISGTYPVSNMPLPNQPPPSAQRLDDLRPALLEHLRDLDHVVRPLGERARTRPGTRRAPLRSRAPRCGHRRGPAPSRPSAGLRSSNVLLPDIDRPPINIPSNTRAMLASYFFLVPLAARLRSTSILAIASRSDASSARGAARVRVGPAIALAACRAHVLGLNCRRIADQLVERAVDELVDARRRPCRRRDHRRHGSGRRPAAGAAPESAAPPR